MLYEIHNQGRHNVVFTCNNCKAHVGTLWQCTNCENFNLCITCYKKEKHAHRMVKHRFDLDSGTSRTDKEKDTWESSRKLIETLKQSLEHAYQCRDVDVNIWSMLFLMQSHVKRRRCVRSVNSLLLCVCIMQTTAPIIGVKFSVSNIKKNLRSTIDVNKLRCCKGVRRWCNKWTS